MSATQPTVGQQVTYRHPAGPVKGTVTAVEPGVITIAVKRWDGMPDAVLVFIQGTDGVYRLKGRRGLVNHYDLQF
jgi:hypothetical protein